MAEIPVTIVVDDPQRLNRVKTACKACGLKHMKALPRLGMLTGVIDQDRLQELAKIPGVRSVERERKITLPPPDSPVQ
jgi:hypothetical protein